VIADIITGYVLLIRGDLKILAIILSNKIIVYKKLCSKFVEIESNCVYLKVNTK
jgi:hypothetical protein